MFKKLFRQNKQESDWEIIIKGGDMIRQCRVTGRREYRDTKRKEWIPLEDGQSLDELREREFRTLPNYRKLADSTNH